MENWFKSSEKELLVSLCISQIEKGKKQNKRYKTVLFILVLNLILSLVNMLLLLK